ncbi:hypothetical protein HEP81_01015 [Streptomyces griseofuscus]|uniref:Uncharacterized protein n=1 Tax=Streptomyces griseofuscus TaxID=146922 RepID=A0A7H1PTG9_9ACTN|nr:hypothetical protein HEP81_01015 [Streptomyces griseofuscus]
MGRGSCGVPGCLCLGDRPPYPARRPPPPPGLRARPPPGPARASTLAPGPPRLLYPAVAPGEPDPACVAEFVLRARASRPSASGSSPGDGFRRGRRCAARPAPVVRRRLRRAAVWVICFGAGLRLSSGPRRAARPDLREPAAPVPVAPSAFVPGFRFRRRCVARPGLGGRVFVSGPLRRRLVPVRSAPAAEAGLRFCDRCRARAPGLCERRPGTRPQPWRVPAPVGSRPPRSAPPAPRHERRAPVPVRDGGAPPLPSAAGIPTRRSPVPVPPRFAAAGS